jgi:hypothetical protein
MQTVTFQCGHCNNLMAVTSDNLGRQVQCPHCQQIVVAPAAQAPAPAPQMPSLSIGESESIFEMPSSDDPLDSSTLRPLLGPIGSADQQTMPLEPGPAPAAGEATQMFVPSEQTASTEMFAPSTVNAPTEVESPPAWQNAAAPETSGPAVEALPSPSVARARRSSETGSKLMLLFFIPLVSYSVLATVFLLILYNRMQNMTVKPYNPLEEAPDVSGDAPGVKKGEKVFNWKPTEEDTQRELPAKQRVPLNQTVRIGDLEVTPQKVELKTVRVFVEGWDRPEPCEHKSLVLHLKVHNASSEWAFAPLDNFFDRQWKQGDGAPPLTVLEVGSQRFFGGPAKWAPISRNRNAERRQWVEGRQNLPKLLAPGETLETLICTDGNNPALEKAVAAHNSGYLWRVHVRRGPVAVEGRSTLVPATAVVGVEFKGDDIVKQ